MQNIAKRGGYGAFLMDDLDRVQHIVTTMTRELTVPVSCKIRRFDCIHQTVAYARMLEAAGCSLLAIHGRTRAQKNLNLHRASWEHMRAVVQAVRIPVLVNGNVMTIQDANR